MAVMGSGQETGPGEASCSAHALLPKGLHLVFGQTRQPAVDQRIALAGTRTRGIKRRVLIVQPPGRAENSHPAGLWMLKVLQQATLTDMRVGQKLLHLFDRPV